MTNSTDTTTTLYLNGDERLGNNMTICTLSELEDFIRENPGERSGTDEYGADWSHPRTPEEAVAEFDPQNYDLFKFETLGELLDHILENWHQLDAEGALKKARALPGFELIDRS